MEAAESAWNRELWYNCTLNLQEARQYVGKKENRRY